MITTRECKLFNLEDPKHLDDYNDYLTKALDSKLGLHIHSEYYVKKTTVTSSSEESMESVTTEVQWVRCIITKIPPLTEGKKILSV